MKEILRYKNILLSIIIIAVSFVLIKGMVLKYFASIKDLKNKMEDLEKSKILVEKWDSVVGEYIKSSKSFFSKDVLLFKKFVEERTKATGINVNYLSPSRRDVDFYVEGSLGMRATAESYENIINFVRSVEEKKVLVESLRIRVEGDKRSADINLKSYILEAK